MRHVLPHRLAYLVPRARSRAVRFAGVILALVACLAGCEPKSAAVRYPVDVASLPAEATFLAEIDRSKGARDCFAVERNGRFVLAGDARRMQPGERVLGIDLGAVAVAYPLQYLNFVELVEHAVGNQMLLVCWCPLCGTGVVHERRIGARPLTFGHSGWMWRGGMLAYDRETDSLWDHASGIAMSGPLRGRRLARFEDTAVMTWAAWRAEHPDTLVLAKPGEPEAPVDSDVYAARNSRVSFGLSIQFPGASRFYPYEGMEPLAAIEDDAAGIPVVVAHDAGAAMTRAFDRRVRGTPLSFDLVAGDRPRLRERGGVREWYARSGAPVPGSGAGAPLRPLAATAFERRAWQAQNPAGTVWRRP